MRAKAGCRIRKKSPRKSERLLKKKDLSGERFVITAGPNREPLDPVRYLSNRSSGKMGYALARAACGGARR